MGDAKKACFRVQFNRRIKLELHGAKVTSNAGLLLYRELDEVFELTAFGSEDLLDDRTGKNIQHATTALLRQYIFSRLADTKKKPLPKRVERSKVHSEVLGVDNFSGS